MKKVFSILFFISLVLTMVSCGDRETAFESKIEEDRQNMRKVLELREIEYLKMPDEIEFKYPVMNKGFITMIAKKVNSGKYNIELADGTYDSQYQAFIDGNILNLIGKFGDFHFEFETKKLEDLKSVTHLVRENIEFKISAVEVFVNQKTLEVSVN